MTKKIIALLLAVLMAFGMFAGCGQETQQPETPDVQQPEEVETSEFGKQADGSFVYEDGVVMSAPGEFPIVKEGEVTLKIGMPRISNVTSYEYGVNEFTTYLQDKTGIKLEFDFLGDSQSTAATQIQLRLATGEELPDVMLDVPLGKFEMWQFGEDGIVLPLQDYIEEYGYYYKQALEDMAEIEPQMLASVNSVKDPDGNLYTFFKYSLSPGSAYDKQWYINKVWLENLGLEVPTTIDELYDVLVAFRDQDPNGNGIKDEIPMLGASGTGGYVAGVDNVIMPAFVYFSPYQHRIADENNKITYVGVTDGFREGVSFIAKLVKEGLIPDFSFTQTNAQQKALCDPPEGEPTVVGIIVENLNFAMRLNESDRAFEYIALGPMTGPDGLCYASVYDTAMKNTSWISAECEYPEIAVRFCDAWYDAEVELTASNGPEGVYWHWLDDYLEANGLTEDDVFNRYDGILENAVINVVTTKGTHNWFSEEHAVTWAQNPIYYTPSNVQGTTDATLGGYDVNTASGYQSYIHDQGVKMRWGKLPENHVPGTLTNLLTEEENNAILDITTDLGNYFYETRQRFMTGDLDATDDAVWENYLAECEEIGINEALEVLQIAYDRYLASK